MHRPDGSRPVGRGTVRALALEAPAIARHEIEIHAPLESWSGDSVEAEAVSVQKALDDPLVAWLQHMKVAAEATN